MDAQEPRVWPSQLRLSPDKRRLTVDFGQDGCFELTAEYLRVESPSAEVQGHGASTKVLQVGKSGVTITHIAPVGNYAVRLTFDDGHDTGLYAWEYLYSLGTGHAQIWQAYLTALEGAGLSR